MLLKFQFLVNSRFHSGLHYFRRLYLIMKISILSILFLLVFSLSGKSQHQYCSKYKTATRENRLVIEDHRSDSLDIIHTIVDLNIRPVLNTSISGNTKLLIKAKTAAVNELRFDFEGLIVDSVLGTTVSGFDHQDSLLYVQLSQPLDQTQQSEITVYYHGQPEQDVTGWGGFYFSGGYAWNLGVGFGADPHSYGRIWFPCFDNFIERSSFEFFITTDSVKTAACNGLLLNEISNGDGTRTFHWKLDQSIPSYLACVAVGNYETLNSEVAGTNGLIPIQLFAKASDTNNLKASFIHLPDAVQKYEAAYGEYRFDKVGYSLVPFNAGAMEHATNITYPIYAANGQLSNESLMAHELGHMWWGDNVTCETDGDMWINEGWASFSVYLFNEAVYGRDAYEKAVMDELRYMLQFGHQREGGYRAISGQPHEYVYGDHVYKKGALAAHNLRGYMGDDLFFSTINSFMEQYKYSPVSSDIMERYFSQSSGIDLEPFFRDWIFTGGYNVVVLDSFNATQDGSNFDVELFVQQKLKGRAAYHDDVPVFYTLFDEQYNSVSARGLMSGKTGTLSVQSSFNPTYVLLYEQNEQAHARTRDVLRVKETGSHDLKNMYWDINVTSVSDSAFAVFDHIWSVPDPIKKWSEKAYKMSNYHYWKVHGIGLSNLEMNAEFKYDGRTSSSNAGFFDMDLLSTTEDSLMLLYRMNATGDWNEYEYYSLNNLGNATDAFGIVTLSKVLPGEYVLANKDVSVLGVKPTAQNAVNIYPNPAKSTLIVNLVGYDSCELKVIDMNGALVKTASIQNGENQISIERLAAGNYIIQLSQKGQIIATQKLVKD
jgi:hypothetical protein